MPVHIMFGYTRDVFSGDLTFGTEFVGVIDGTRGNKDLQMYRGDSNLYRVYTRDKRNNVVSLLSAAIWFTVRDKSRLQEDDDTNIIFQRKNVGAGGDNSQILIENTALGIFEIYIIPSNTHSISFDEYEYDIQVKLSTGGIYTINRGTFTLLSETTRSQ